MFLGNFVKIRSEFFQFVRQLRALQVFVIHAVHTLQTNADENNQ